MNVDVGMKIEIFPSPKTHIKGGGLRISPSPRDYIKAVLGIFPSPKAHIDMGVPNPIYCIDIFLHIVLANPEITP